MSLFHQRLTRDSFALTRLDHLPVFERSRARMVMFINACAVVFTLGALCVVGIHESYEGVRAFNLTVTLILAGLLSCNHELIRRGHVAVAVQSLGAIVIAGVTCSVVSTQQLEPFFWLLTLAGLVSFFSTRPTQVLMMAGFTVLCAALCQAHLEGTLPEEFLEDEIARVTVTCLMIMVLAFLKTRTYVELSTQLIDNHETTAHAAQHAARHRALLLKHLDRAHALDQRKSRFLADMSHELRTPLNVILGYTELLHEEVLDSSHTLPDTVREDTEMIQIASNHLLSLIDEVLDLEEIEQGELRFVPRTIDVVEVSSEVCVAMQYAASQRGNKLLLTHAHPTLTLDQDDTLLRQLLFNFISNAIKFTTHGLIEVELLPITSPLGTRISVMDTGKGISAEDLASIREEFTQASTQQLKEYGGTGLGLSLCYRLVEVMGGTLDIKSTLGEGTQVILTLPDMRGEEP